MAAWSVFNHRLPHLRRGSLSLACQTVTAARPYGSSITSAVRSLGGGDSTFCKRQLLGAFDGGAQDNLRVVSDGRAA